MKIILLLTLFFCGAQVSFAQSGKLDSSFGNNGVVRTDFNFVFDYNYLTSGSHSQVLLQPDGSMYILIEADDRVDARTSYLAKRLSDGSPDYSYGNNGFSVPIPVAEAHVVQQSDGKIIVIGQYLIARLNPDGTLDNSFDGDGIKYIDYYSTSVAVQSDNKILVTAARSNGSNNLLISRFNSDGSLDATFNVDGDFTTDSAYSIGAAAIAVQSDGQIVAGFINKDGNIAVNRYNNNGSYDITFSNDGKQTTPVNGQSGSIRAIEIQSDGKILVGGFTEYGILARYNANGSLDSTFSNDGIQEINNGFITSIASEVNGKITVACYFGVVRLNNDGTFDSTFSNDGIQTSEFNSFPISAVSVAIQSDGKIVAAGNVGDFFTGPYSFGVVRYNPDGTLDDSFDNDGKVIDKLQLKQGSTFFKGSAVQTDGKIVAAGYTWNGSNYDFALARYNIDGSLDKTFSGDGLQNTDFSIGDDYANSIVIQSDGKILLGGTSNSNFALVRYNSDGSLDNTFSIDGKQITDFGPSSTDFGSTSYINSIAIQNDGKIIAAGAANGSFAIARYNVDGVLDNSFSEDGKLSTEFRIPTEFGALDDGSFIKSVAIQNDGKIVAAGRMGYYIERSADYNFIAVARYNTDGTLDNTFSEDGKQTTSLVWDGSAYYKSSANSVTLQNDGKIVVGGGSISPEDGQNNFTIVRYNANGSLDDTFSGDGAEIIDLGIQASAISVAIQNDGKILLAGPAGQYFAVARFNTNGDLDSTLNGTGITLIESSSIFNGLESVTISDNKFYATGYVADPGNLGVVTKYILIEDTSPKVAITSPAEDSTYKTEKSIVLSANASDADGTVKMVQFYNGNKLIGTESDAPYYRKWYNVAPGNYTITAKATDNDGNVTVSAPVHITVIHNQPPVVSITSPVNGANYLAPATIIIRANASDPDGTIKKVEFYEGATLLHTEYYSRYLWYWKDLPAGTYTITAKAIDDNGKATVSAPVTITVSAQQMVRGTSSNNQLSFKKPAPEVYKESLSLKLNPNPAKDILNISIEGFKTDSRSAISVISISGSLVKTIQTNALNRNLQLNVSSLKPGSYFIKVINGDKVMYKQFIKL